MDGVSGVTQCPQQPGTSFTYQFTVTDQFGTFCELSIYVTEFQDDFISSFLIHETDSSLAHNSLRLLL